MRILKNLFRTASAVTLVLAIVSLLTPNSVCGDDKEMKVSRKDVATGPTLVTVTATDYAFDAPDTIKAGFTTFRLVNKGSQLHMAQLIRLEGGKTLEDFLKAYSEAFRTVGPRPQWAKRLGGPGAAEPHGESNATLYMKPGSYAWICVMNVPDGIPHVVKAGMAKPFTVQARSREAAAQIQPKASVVIRMIDYAFGISPPLTSGRHTIRVENAGVEPHEVGVVKLAPGKTLEDFKASMQNPQGPPAAKLLGGISALAAKAEGYFEVELTPGDYVFLCFVTAPDGRPHTEHGMIQHIRIE